MKKVILLLPLLMLFGCATGPTPKPTPHPDTLEWATMNYEKAQKAFNNCMKKEGACNEDSCSSEIPEACLPALSKYLQAKNELKKRCELIKKVSYGIEGSSVCLNLGYSS